MDRRSRDTWENYWVDQPPTVRARTMTQLLDRIKVERLRAILSGQRRLLEVGCGSARLSCLLAAEGHRTVCLDFSLRGLQAARANYRAVGVAGWFVGGECRELPFPDSSFDVVLSTGLFEHFEDPAPIAREMARVLKPWGLFYSDIVPWKFSLFRSLEWVGRLKRALTGQPQAVPALYERSFTGPQIRALLAGVGLVGIQVLPAGVVPPYLPLLYRSPVLREAEVRLVERGQAIWKRLD